MFALKLTRIMSLLTTLYLSDTSGQKTQEYLFVIVVDNFNFYCSVADIQAHN